MTKHPRDITFDDMSAYGSVKWAALTLGKRYSWFMRERSRLETAGFPKPDLITGHYIKADVEAWITKRRQIADRVEVQPTTESQPRINPDDL